MALMKSLNARTAATERLDIGVLVSVFICFSMIASGVEPSSAIFLTIVIAMQSLGGIAIWDWTTHGRSISAIEVMSMGAAIGFILATVLDQLFINTPIRQVAWLIPSVLTIAFYLLKNQTNSFADSPLDSWPISWHALFLFAAALMAYSPIEKYQLVGAVLLLVFVEALRRSFSNKQPSRSVSLFLPLTGIASITGFMYWLARQIPTQSLFYRQLFIGTDDIMMNEQRASSVALWGLSDHTAAAGIPMKYHWLSLAWSGMTSRIAQAQPFAVTLHLAPLIAFVVIGFLLWSIASRLTSNRWVILSAAPLLFLSNSQPVSFRFYYVNNVSNVFTHIWFFAFLLCFLNSLERPSIRSVLLLPVFASAVILGKGPFGISLAVGICVSLSYIVIFARHLKFLAAALVGSLSFMALTYLCFIRSKDLVSAYIWNWTQFKALFPFPFVNTDSTPSRYFVGALLILGIFITRFPGFWMIRHRSEKRDHPLLALLIGCMLSGFLTFILKGWTAEFYFMNAALCAGALLALFVLISAHKDAVFSSAGEFGVLVLSTGVIYLFSTLLIYQITDAQPGQKTVSSLPFITASLSYLVILIRKKDFVLKTAKKTFRVVPIVFILCASFTQVANIAKDVVSVIAEPNNWIPSSEVPALNWIRSNTSPRDIIATNRYVCPISPRCDNRDPNTGGSYLISAITQRRVLLEGPKMLLPEALRYSLYPDWVQSRANDELNFINSPSAQTLKKLQLRNVKWVYIVKNQTANTKWKPFAISRFETPTVVVLELISIK